MPTLCIRDFPEHLHSKIKALARQSSRTVSQQAIVLIEEALNAERTQATGLEALNRIAARRRSYEAPLVAVDSLTLLREDRNR